MIIEKKLSYPILYIDKPENKIQHKSITLKINDDNNIYNVHRAVVHQLANKRQRSANTKTRSEVRGGGKKPWKQKGSGKARAGSSRSPLWKGGGVIFGPKPRNSNSKIKINHKEKQLALRNILYNRFENTFIIDNSIAKISKPSTKTALNTLKNLNINISISKKILIITAQKNHNFYLSTRNLPNIQLIYANQLNVFALLKANILIITTDAIDIINKTYNGNK